MAKEDKITRSRSAGIPLNLTPLWSSGSGSLLLLGGARLALHTSLARQLGRDFLSSRSTLAHDSREKDQFDIQFTALILNAESAVRKGYIQLLSRSTRF